ncbi:MAG: ribonuclease P protein component [Acetobacteraceae bacterium]|nr:ribonuclease P protein component [Acetobacteraceae bacterium]
MDSARGWKPSAAAGCWRIAAPRAASAFPPKDRRPNAGRAPRVFQPPPETPTRLKRRAEFLRVAAKGRKAATHGLVLQALRQAEPGPARIGFTVTKKIGGAVVRNRTRRRLKEAARLELAQNPVAGVDLVLIGREGTRGRDFLQLRDDLRRALRKAEVL